MLNQDRKLPERHESRCVRQGVENWIVCRQEAPLWATLPEVWDVLFLFAFT